MSIDRILVSNYIFVCYCFFLSLRQLFGLHVQNLHYSSLGTVSYLVWVYLSMILFARCKITNTIEIWTQQSNTYTIRLNPSLGTRISWFWPKQQTITICCYLINGLDYMNYYEFVLLSQILSVDSEWMNSKFGLMLRHVIDALFVCLFVC